MGLKKYILRKGLGSPGQTARVWANHYNRSLGSNMTEIEALEGVIISFQFGQSSVNNLLHESQPESILSYSDGDLAIVLFWLLLDTPGFSNNVRQFFDDTTEVIHSEISKIAPRSLKCDLPGFKQKATNLLNRDLY